MGISCISVYSDADINALHALQADELKYIGQAPAALSYLNIERICQVAVETGVDAVHPGYGFLSENPEFPRALKKYNVDYIGPSAETIEMMANKITAKEIARKAEVNIVPGYIGEILGMDHAIKIAEEIGFPVMLKAAAGGGGKGMRVINSSKEIEMALTSARNEAEKNFKDSSIFIEKYIEHPRHIEIQILADKYGNIICLGERECSIQRLNQKVIEESPSPFLTNEVRQEMYKQCISLAKKANYFSAGTVEFIVDQNKNFYFLEVNTRLQVEHPVTEFVTGIDIVEEMIRISCGEKLRFNQDNIKFTGSSIEARIYAENTSKNFFPSSGRIKYYNKPEETNYVRIDDGITAGSDVSMFYDPMLAKLIVHGNSRLEAIGRMQKALSEFYIEGIENNIEFLESIFHHQDFIAADIHTKFIPDFYSRGFQGDYVTEEYVKISILASLYIYFEDEHSHHYNSSYIDQELIIMVDSYEHSIKAEFFNHELKAIYNHNIYCVKGKWDLNHKLLYMLINNEVEITVKVSKKNNKFSVGYAGMKTLCQVFKPHVAELNKWMINNSQIKESVQNTVESPISGLLTKLYVRHGDEIEIEQPLFIVEAMKMENIIRSETKGIIKNIIIQEGKAVQADDVILELHTENV